VAAGAWICFSGTSRFFGRIQFSALPFNSLKVAAGSIGGKEGKEPMNRKDSPVVHLLVLVAAVAILFVLVKPHDSQGDNRQRDSSVAQLSIDLSGLQQKYLELWSQKKETDPQLTADLLETGSNLVLTVRRVERDGGKVDRKVVGQIQLIPLSIGCQSLSTTENDQLLRINIYLQHNHRPMCLDASDSISKAP